MRAQLFIVASVILTLFLISTYLMLKPDYLKEYRDYWEIKRNVFESSFKKLTFNPTGEMMIIDAKQKSIVRLNFPEGKLPTNKILFLEPMGDYYEYFVTDKYLYLGNLSCIKLIPLFNYTTYYLIYGDDYFANLTLNSLNINNSVFLNLSVNQIITNFSGPVVKGSVNITFLPDAIILENKTLLLKVNASGYTNGSNWIKFTDPTIGLTFDHDYFINYTGSYYIVNLTSGNLLRVFPGKLSFDYDYDNASIIRISEPMKGRNIDEYVGQEDWLYNYIYRTPLMLIGNSLLPLLIKLNKTAINMSETFSLIDGNALIILPFINKKATYVYYNETGQPGVSVTDIILHNETGNVYFKNSFYAWNITDKKLYIGEKQVLHGDVIVCINNSCENLSNLYFSDSKSAYAKIGPLLLLAKYPGILIDERNCETVSVKFPINFSSSDFIGINSKGKEVWIKSCDNAIVGDWFNLTIACDEKPSFIIFGPKKFVDSACESYYKYYLWVYGIQIQTLKGPIILFG